jgi:hypothetical protein
MKYRGLKKKLFLALTFGSFAHADICLDSNDPFTVINVGLTYEKSKFGHLPGVKKDVATMNKIFGRFKHKANFSDQNFKDKEDFIREITIQVSAAKKRGGGHPSIFFNYAGHGILTKDGGFSIPLPSLPSSCMLKQELQFTGVENAKMYRGSFSVSYLEAQRGLGRIELNACDKKRNFQVVECDDKLFTKTVYVVNDLDPNCAKYIVTSNDFKKLFEGTELFGFVDACHSGALTSLPGSSFIASTQAHELASDEGGGQLFSFVDDAISKYSCSLQKKPSEDSLSLLDLWRSLPKVSYYVTTPARISSTRNFSAEATQAIYFQSQSPTVSERLKNGSGACGARFSLPLISERECSNPLSQTHIVTQPIECENGAILKSGDSIVVTNEFAESKITRAFAQSCGAFEMTAGVARQSIRRASTPGPAVSAPISPYGTKK